MSSQPAVGLPAGHLTMRLAHRAMLRDLGRIATTATALADSPDPAQATALTDYADRILQIIEHHHEGEDEFLWPMLRERGAGEDVLTLMTEEHAELLGHLKDVTGRLTALDGATAWAGFGAAVQRLRDSLAAHCADEERELTDRLAPALDASAWSRFERNMVKTAPKWTLAFMPPWLDSVAEPAERAGVPARPVAKLMAGSLRRRQQRAFGD
ncbi:Hemerythrin HHE cation binding domain-containing protein [Micromonospora pallida]|uniref:Hemerythrin HHE cation binding domain-containing protein n=1 Tax=Micromonospora pallida TaxID=145854 RepID=A0A1C6SM69_9ACTN|nr:hemerythrin domain-containing protein [Micromonospora pallida]SCL30686.1 Hemerythrin HHE cation binding domain-containing protein [Micromonospora pallida]